MLFRSYVAREAADAEAPAAIAEAPAAEAPVVEAEAPVDDETPVSEAE